MANAYETLTPELVLDSLESSLSRTGPGTRATGRILGLNSLENRVFEVEFEDGTFVVTKFYRPGRWTAKQISAEHEFLKRLKKAEVPAVAPLDLNNQSTVGLAGEFLFAVFPKVKGRIHLELSVDQLRIVGRYLGRLHNVGAQLATLDRPTLGTEHHAKRSLAILEKSDFLHSPWKERYTQVVQQLIGLIDRQLQGAARIAVHGDVHPGNILWDGDSPFFVDFDDMVLAPAVQDFWLITQGRGEQVEKARNELLLGYEQFRPFDRSTFGLIEPLRALRVIHYSAWIA